MRGRSGSDTVGLKFHPLKIAMSWRPFIYCQCSCPCPGSPPEERSEPTRSSEWPQ
uniref:Uncharacterized protein n=1 Tax=Anguilla anguilla TaxID=7936 RepID=A0A0E9W099_ANGAN